MSAHLARAASAHDIDRGISITRAEMQVRAIARLVREDAPSLMRRYGHRVDHRQWVAWDVSAVPCSRRAQRLAGLAR